MCNIIHFNGLKPADVCCPSFHGLCEVVFSIVSQVGLYLGCITMIYGVYIYIYYLFIFFYSYYIYIYIYLMGVL